MEGRRIRGQAELYNEVRSLPKAYHYRDCSYQGPSVADIIYAALINR